MMVATLGSSFVLALAVLNDQYFNRLLTGIDRGAKMRDHIVIQFLLGLCSAAWLSWTPVLLTGNADTILFAVWSAIMVVVVPLLVASDVTRYSPFSWSERSPKCHK